MAAMACTCQDLLHAVLGSGMTKLNLDLSKTKVSRYVNKAHLASNEAWS
jgi:hypothetical protein